MGRRVSSVGCVNFKNYNGSKHHLLALRLLWGGVGDLALLTIFSAYVRPPLAGVGLNLSNHVLIVPSKVITTSSKRTSQFGDTTCTVPVIRELVV